MDSYFLDISLDHRLELGASDRYSEIVQDYEARIICDRDETESVAGTFSFYVANVPLAVNCGLDIVDVADSIDEDLYVYCSALFKPGTASELRPEVTDLFEYPMVGRMLMLHLAKVLPEHRGKHLGLVAAHKIIEQFGNGLVVAFPQPLQHHSGYNREKKMGYETFEPVREAALKRLTRHWQRLGFKPIAGTGCLGLSTEFVLPTPKLRLKPTSTTKPKTRRKV
jgi:hypothetical protein